jgi:hypothetical protein
MRTKQIKSKKYAKHVFKAMTLEAEAETKAKDMISFHRESPRTTSLAINDCCML